MGCFLVPAAEAVIATVATKVVEKKEQKAVSSEVQLKDGTVAERLPFSRKLRWLSNLLWGGTVLLVFEHLWHGEIVPWAPFLTAAGSPQALAVLLQEMATVGVGMAVLVTAVWVGMVVITSVLEKRALKEPEPVQE